MNNLNSRFIYFIFSVAFILALLLCLALIDIPRIVKTQGYTTGATNISKINVQIPGVLINLFALDQALVKQGDVLGEITSERFMRGRSLDAEQAQIIEEKLFLNTH